tara:strand:+ start:34 stop:1203 length:1170 start_codon:yes stop_codon:yes gene_type:complete
MYSILLILLFALVFLILIELNHKFRPYSPLEISPRDWKINKTEDHMIIEGNITIYNPMSKMEIMVPEISINPKILGGDEINYLKIEKQIISNHPDEESRSDFYWPAYILKGKKETNAFVRLIIKNSKGLKHIDNIENIWINVDWYNYGPFGRVKRKDGFNIPIKKPEVLRSDDLVFKSIENIKILPIKTHIWGRLDTIADIIKLYCGDIINKGDIITIGETPLAIIQGRYIHPSNIYISSISKVLCRLFHPTSSLATACGFQSLIDIYGPSRILISVILGILAKIIGIKGLFYRLAGEQARLIDDITGTTPPYDQTIVLGPKNSERICNELSRKFKVSIAIVDVNDLGKVKILASSNKCNKNLVFNALKSNPAGNANQQTPIVLIRECI